ncbi:MAG: GNAT family N-acetyltransferase, partial [Oscillospiraceae bacterium]|nr:GNAT family N-acetyltransferase [Oscillospiraceae bacterium]
TNERHNNDALYLSSFIDDYDKYAFCIVVDNTIVGYITAILFPSWNTIKVVFIDSFAIEPSMQRKGVGSEALKQFINVFPEGTAMQLMTTKDRPAYAFYQKLGFLDMADLGDYGLRLLIR